MSEQITLMGITTINSEGVGFKFHGLKHFNDKWFSWAAISKAVLHREDEISIDSKCSMPSQKHLESELSACRKELEEAKADGWTCYHCGEKFITHTHAKLHFGIPHSGAQPACVMKAEQGLVKYIRELELRLGKAMEEDSDVLRDMANQRVEKANAVSDAEELGYSRGLQAYTKIEAELSATQAREVRLVEVLKEVDTMVNNQGLSHQLIQKALSNSTEHTEKWLAEHDAKVLTDVADEILETVSHSDVDNHEFENGKEAAAQWIKIKASELRSGK